MTVYTNIGDIRFYYTANNVDNIGPADVDLTGADLHRDPGLETSVNISLFSNARAREQDELPQGTTNRYGYFGTLVAGFEIGSRIWLLNRSVINEITLRHFEQYTKDALRWMVDDSIASEIQCVASRVGIYQINWATQIIRPNDIVNFKHFINWQYQKYGNIE